MLTIEEVIAFLEQECDNDGRLYSASDEQAALKNGHDYIFRYSRRMGGMCMCSACGSNVDIADCNHGNFVRCPECGKIVMVKDEWRGHKYLYDSQILYSWRRYGAETLIVVGMYCDRSFGQDWPERAQMGIRPEAIWQFEPGRAKKYVRHYYGGWSANIRGIRPLNHPGAAECHTGMREAMAGTRLGRIYDAIDDNGAGIDLDRITAMGAIARKRYIEYLCAAKQVELAAEIAMGCKNIMANPRAKRAEQLLGLTEGQWFEVRRDGIDLNAGILHALRCVQVSGRMEIRIREAVDIAMRVKPWLLDRLWERSDRLLDGVPEKLRRKAIRRAVAGDDTQEWMDYWDQLIRLGEDRTDARMLIPRDMPAMHERMTARLQAIQEEERRRLNAWQNEEFDNRLKKLKRRYCFAAGGLVLRPYESAAEVIAEGQALHICIGGYAKSYMDGRTILCCLRHEDAPEDPWRAVEFSVQSGELVQDRGAYNDRNQGKHNFDNGVRGQLDSFWAQFYAAKRRKTA